MAERLSGPRRAKGTLLPGRLKVTLLAALVVVLFGIAAGPRLVERITPGHAGAYGDPSGTTIENLLAFAKLYGYVRYFHPSDAASSIDWERFAVHITACA